VDFDPDNLLYPSEDSLKKDCYVLASGPFKGIITFGSEYSLGLVPKVARQCGIQGIIMGIWNIKNTDELEAAVACRDIVDGYCVGHRSLGELYDLEELLQAISTVRERTRRPVTTTESINDFVAYPQLIQAVDWVFPDMHYYWHEGAAPEEVISDLMTSIKGIQDWFEDTGHRRVLLKMVSYPSSGAPGLTESDQARFFGLLLRRIRDDTSISRSVAISVFAAFDKIWKTPERGWSPADRSTGLYAIDRRPKMALQYIENPWRSP
jgi:exo-beta-1,3-glucanase (GH17 family)